MTFDQLQTLHNELGIVADMLDDDEIVPERYMSTAAGLLAEHDARSLREARAVVHRLMLWRKFPRGAVEPYLAPLPEITPESRKA